MKHAHEVKPGTGRLTEQPPGLPRTLEDITHAIMIMLRHPVGSTWSDARIAAHVGVDEDHVEQVREHLELRTLEAVIADGLRSFVEVGRALAAIQKGGLYLDQGFKTFAQYCEGRWDRKRQWAYQLIGASSVLENVRHGVQEYGAPQLNERQARELAKLPAEEQAEAWAEVVNSSPVITARAVAEVVARRLPPPVEAKPRLKPAPEPEPLPALRAPVRFEVLDALREQRNADPNFASWLATQRQLAKSMPSKSERMVTFILDGGEVALARLGLDWSATQDDARRAYRSAARVAHPDLGGNPAEFSALTKAHDLVREFLAA